MASRERFVAKQNVENYLCYIGDVTDLTVAAVVSHLLVQEGARLALYSSPADNLERYVEKCNGAIGQLLGRLQDGDHSEQTREMLQRTLKNITSARDTFKTARNGVVEQR